jgi:hypothetical protein
MPDLHKEARPPATNIRNSRGHINAVIGHRAYLYQVHFRTAGGDMSNDAKLGLVLGVAIVLVIALVFFRGDSANAKAASGAAAGRIPIATGVR